MSSDVEEPVDLRLFDPEAFEKASRDAKKLDDLARKVQQSRKKLAAGLAPINIPSSMSPHGTLPKQSPSAKIPAGQYLNPQGAQKPLASGRAPLAGQQSQQSSAQKFKKDIEDDFLKKLGLDKIANRSYGYQDYAQLAINPKGFIAGEIISVFKDTSIGAAILFAPELLEKLIEHIEKQFEAGGLLDVRKFIPDAVKSIPQLSQMIDESSGNVYFTPNSGPMVRQGSPESSNTSNAQRNDYMKYIALYRGT